MVAITSLLLVVAISLLITRVATVILTATGMSRQSARFQARSAFTGAGFTTKESEEVVNHPLRRRVIATLMLLGNAGIVASASSAILGLRSSGLGATGWRALELVLGLIALIAISRSQWVDVRLTRLIGRLLQRFTDLTTRDLDNLLDLSGSYAVSELAVREGDWLDGRTLGELGLSAEGVVVLGVNRPDGGYVGVPVPQTRVRAGDVLVVYGEESGVDEVDRRPSGPVGDELHRAAVTRHEAVQQEQVLRQR
jgi:hypothetical protein